MAFEKDAPDLPVPPQMTGRRSMSELSAIRPQLTPAQACYAGRIGGNQSFVLDRNNPQNASELERVPDAAPFMSLRASLDLHGFAEIELWKAAVQEGLGEPIILVLLQIRACLVMLND